MNNWFRNLFRRDALPVSELKSLVYGPPTVAGVSVSEESALGLSAVYRAVDLISSTIASLDGETYRHVPGKGKVLQPRHRVTQVLHDPNDDMNAFKLWRTLIQHVVCGGNGFLEVERDTLDQPIGLHLVHWRNVRIARAPDGKIFYTLIREARDVPASDMLHLTTISWDGVVGISPIRAARESLGIGVAAERYAGTVYGNGAVPRGFLKTSDVLSPEGKANIREAWNIIYGGPSQANQVGFLGPGTEWIETSMTPEDSQLLLSRTFQIEEVSRIFGVPSNLLFSGNQGSYNSNEESNIQFLQLGLRPLLENLESEIDFKLLTRDERQKGYFVRYATDKLIQGNFKAVTDAWSRLVLTGVASQNEARERIGLNPREGADDLFMPVNMAISTDEKGTETANYALPKPEAKSNAAPLALEPPLDRLHVEDKVARDYSRATFTAEIGRALRRQARSKPDTSDHRNYLVDALASDFRLYAHLHGKTSNVEDFAHRWVNHTLGKDPAEIDPDEMLALID